MYLLDVECHATIVLDVRLSNVNGVMSYENWPTAYDFDVGALIAQPHGCELLQDLIRSGQVELPPFLRERFL